MQDVHLGLLVALLPALAGQKGMAPSRSNAGVVHNILNGLEKENDSGNLGLTMIAKQFLPLTGLKKVQTSCLRQVDFFAGQVAVFLLLNLTSPMVNGPSKSASNKMIN